MHVTPNLYRCGFADAVCLSLFSGKSSRRGRRYPAGAHAVAVSASLRLRCDARPGVGIAELAARPEGRYAQTAAMSQFTKRAKRARPQAEHRSRHRMRPRRVPPAASQHGGRACNEYQPCTKRWVCLQRTPTMSPQSRVRAGRGASLRGAWVCLISWPRACALRELTRRACLNEAASGRVVSCATRPRNQANPGESVRSTDRLADAPRPARTRLCRVPLHCMHYRINFSDPASRRCHQFRDETAEPTAERSGQ